MEKKWSYFVEKSAIFIMLTPHRALCRGLIISSALHNNLVRNALVFPFSQEETEAQQKEVN